jgi:hypothetical protein
VVDERDVELIGLGYTLATGRLWAGGAEWHKFAEGLLGRPILTHEFASEHLWAELRRRFEAGYRELRGPEEVIQ